MRRILQFASESLKLASILPVKDFLRWAAKCVAYIPAILRKRSLGPVDDAFGTTVRFHSGGRVIEVRDGALGVVREIVGSECYGKAGDFRSARHILDLGANCGVFTLFALANAPGATVTAVELQPELAAIARENVLRNGFAARTHIENKCAGAPNDALTRLFAGGALPELFDFEGYLERVGTCDFLKCDIEGSEFDLITNEATWLRSVRRVGIEYHGDWDAGSRLRTILESHGFTVQQLPHGTLGYLLAIRS